MIFTTEELADIGAALDMAAKRTEDELKLQRAKPYTRAIELQLRRYQSLLAKVVKEVGA
jgi:hypothetical protein